MIEKKKNGSQGLVCPTPREYACTLQKYSKILSETAWPVKAKFYMPHLEKGKTNVFINNPGHMTKMPILCLNPSKISRTGELISMRLGM